MPKYIIKNCPAITTGWHDNNYICNTHQMGCDYCKNCTDCTMKRIVEKCREADGKVVGYTKGNVYNYDTKEFKIADVPLIAENSLAKEILNMLDIEECE